MAYGNENSSIWTRFHEAADLLRKCIEERRSAREAAEKITQVTHENVSRNQVIGKAGRMGLAFVGGGHRARKAHPPRRNTEVGLIPLPEFGDDPKKFDESIPLEQRLTFAQIQFNDHKCRFMVGEPNGPHFYCGGAALEGMSWCQEHFRRCFNPAAPRRPATPFHPPRGRS